MIDKDMYCDDVLNQIVAVQSAMNSVSKLLLENHMKSCVAKRLESGETEVIDEFVGYHKVWDCVHKVWDCNHKV